MVFRWREQDNNNGCRSFPSCKKFYSYVLLKFLEFPGNYKLINEVPRDKYISSMIDESTLVRKTITKTETLECLAKLFVSSEKIAKKISN